jgi:thiol:disulfide interchange protein
LLASLAALVLSGGCGPVPAPTVAPAAAAPAATADAAEVAVKVVNLDQLEAAIAAHKGKVVLLDVWSVT